MTFRNQALMTFAIALGLIVAGQYIEKNRTSFSASIYTEATNISRAYFEVRGNNEVIPAPGEAPIMVKDWPCPVDYDKPHRRRSNSCRPYRIYRNGCGTWRYQTVARNFGRLNCWR